MAFIGFLNLALLAGLAAVAIPPLIHLLNRRRFDVVDWGAMQFLQVSETTRRRLLIEELLLMLLRMGLIAILVMALAAPYTTLPAAGLGSRPNRDVVLILDGSYSMGYAGTGQSAHETAREWGLNFLNDQLIAGDSVAILQAKQEVVPVLPGLTHDLEAAREALRNLAPPRGGCDFPRAIEAAVKILASGTRPQRDIIILGDGQRFGWADDRAMLGWRRTAQALRGLRSQPLIWVVNVDPDRPADPLNWSVAPLTTSRAVAAVGQEVPFRYALRLHHQAEYQPPHRLRLEIDGRPAGELPAPKSARLERGQLPLAFRQRFSAPGSHLVSVIVEPDPPPGERPPGYVIKDHLPGDNRQDFALEVVPALPVLIVDGDTRPMPRRRGSDFLRDALSPARDPTPTARVKVVPVQAFDPDSLIQDVGPEAGSRPRVLILSDVPQLTGTQEEAIIRFLDEGGGVLVTLGERAQADYYNRRLFAAGQGWLPARLESLAGTETDLTQAARPQPATFFHPTLDIFREQTASGLAEVRLPRWWKLAVPGPGSPALPVALLTNGDPLLVERPFHAGRVLQVAVPLDDSFRTNLPELPAFVPLTHELVSYLAGARSARWNLQPGQPIHYRPTDGYSGPLTLQLPDGESKDVTPPRWPLTFEATRETGVYRLERDDGRSVYYVVQPDARESDLAPATESDRTQVSEKVKMNYITDPAALGLALEQADQKQEMWWWFLLAVVALLCGEVWLTRRIVQNRSM